MLEAISNLHNALVGSRRRWKIDQHQRARVQALQIVGALEIMSSKPTHRDVVAPEKEGYYNVDQVRADHVCPEGISPDISRCHRYKELVGAFELRNY